MTCAASSSSYGRSVYGPAARPWMAARGLGASILLDRVLPLVSLLLAGEQLLRESDTLQKERMT
jgi:hypothetical protein